MWRNSEDKEQLLFSIPTLCFGWKHFIYYTGQQPYLPFALDAISQGYSESPFASREYIDIYSKTIYRIDSSEQAELTHSQDVHSWKIVSP